MTTRLLPSFQSAQVLICGDVMLDRYWRGAVERISPEAPIPIVRVDSQKSLPGGAGNVALNVAALGAHTTLVGYIGADLDGNQLQQALTAAGVQQSLVVHKDFPTICKLRVLGAQQQLIRLDLESTRPFSALPELWNQYNHALQTANVVIFSDYAKGTLFDIQRLIQAARLRQIPIVIDPKGQDFQRYAGANLLTPNLKEFEAVVGACPSEQDIIQKAQMLLNTLAIDALLITRGKDGMTFVARGQAPISYPTMAREVFDVSGAGDTVVGVIGAALGVQANVSDAIFWANVAAGIVVGKLGAATVSPHELQQALQAQTSTVSLESGVICDRSHLQRCLAQARMRGERIVMTNGCFDLLHAGHIDYLTQAKALGDRLLIAVNDDDSVRRLKGSSRPLNKVEDRMALLAALKVVDWVVPFSEDTPRNLVAQVLPDVMVKGGDYLPEQVAGGEIVQAHGGSLVILPFKPGYSTTQLLHKSHELLAQEQMA